MRSKVQLLIIFCLVTSTTFEAKAHDPDQISYHFMRYGEGAKLEVHFTPAGAFELIKSLHMELNDTSIIRLSDYTRDFETYFNETISLRIADERMEFQLKSANLVQHDAVLNFDLVNFQGSFDAFCLNISSFTELYRNTLNHVMISDLNVLNQFTLDVSTQTFTNIKAKTKEGESSNSRPIILTFMVLISITGLGIHHLRKRHNSFRFINQ